MQNWGRRRKATLAQGGTNRFTRRALVAGGGIAVTAAAVRAGIERAESSTDKATPRLDGIAARHRTPIMCVTGLGLVACALITSGCSLASHGTTIATSTHSASAVQSRHVYHHLVFKPAKGWKTNATRDRNNEQAWAVYPSSSSSPPGDAGPSFFFVKRSPRNSILILAGAAIPNSFQTSRFWPRRSFPFNIRTMAAERSWEGQQFARIQLRGQAARVGRQRVWVSIYFGNQHPTAHELRAAQTELDRLQLLVIAPTPSK
jgi:hypothetical protein